VALQSENREYNNFIRGIVTEANPLTFPENASIDEANFVLNFDGSRQRRLGIDLEAGYTATAVPSMTSAAIGVSCHEWKNAGNTVANQFAVVQVGDKLLVYNADADAISSSLIATIDASSVIIDETKEIQAASGMGFFFFASGSGSTAALEYVGTTVTLRAINMKIRDFFGVYDGLTVDNRPASLSNAHKYNLFNQGWDAAKNSAVFSNRGSYPSNAEIWYVAKNADDDFAPARLTKTDFGTSAAPKGRYIIDAFDRSTSRTAVSGISGLASDIETSRPACVEFFQQRIWYAGLNGSAVTLTDTSPSMQGFVFYSRIIRTPQDFGQCHPDTDPTSEIDNEPSAVDGGYLNIPDSGQIYKLVPLLDMLIILAQNGVWAITGGDSGFSGVEQQVQKISDFGCVSGSAAVKTETSVLYWSDSGIYMIGSGEGGLAVENISKKTVHKLFSDIPKANKKHAVGNYDPINKRVSWLYSSDLAYDGTNYKFRFDTELLLDASLGAFYKNTISTLTTGTSPYLAGQLTTPDLINAGTLGSSSTKYLTIWYEIGSPIPNVAFSHYWNRQFVDWKSYNGVGRYFESYLLTGHELVGTILSTKQAPWILAFSKRTENNIVAVSGGGVEYDYPSALVLQSRWDFADSATSGKWGPEQQAYRLNRPFILPVAGQPLDYGHEVIITKNRLTGRGKALSFLFKSENGKDAHILGWAVRFTGTSVI
jgi:hypothetical protein